jgi:hypothetical protein
MKSIRTPLPKESSYQAGKQIYNDGPMQPEKLFQLVDMGPRASDRKESLERAIKAGWLTILSDVNVDLTEHSCRHYDKESAASSQKGEVATPRENVHAFTPLSPKHFLNAKGPREDAWDNSTRAIPSHHAKVMQ